MRVCGCLTCRVLQHRERGRPAYARDPGSIALKFFARSSSERIKKAMKTIGRKTVRAEASAPKKVTAPATTAAKASSSVATTRPAPTRDQIAQRSYELYLARGGANGSAEQDWLQAETELLGR